MLGSYHGRSITLSTTLNDRHCTRRSRPSIFFTSTTISPLTRLVTVRNLDRSTPPTKVPQGRRRQLECFSAICRGRRPMRAKHQYFYSLICEHAYWDRRPDSPHLQQSTEAGRHPLQLSHTTHCHIYRSHDLGVQSTLLPRRSVP